MPDMAEVSDFFDREFLARLDRLHILAKELAGRSLTGARRSRGMGDGLEFADYRDYAPGDDPRFIDWPYFARMGKLLLRMFHRHSESDVAILLDSSASMAVGQAEAKFNYARRAAAAIAYVAVAGGERAILQPFCDSPVEPMRTSRDRMQMTAALDYLRALVPAGRTALGDTVEKFTHRGGYSAGTAFLVSDFLDCSDQLSGALARLRLSGWEVVVIHVVDPGDCAPQLSGAVSLTDAETGRRIELQADAQMLAAYAAQWEKFRHGIELAAGAAGATYVLAAADAGLEELMLYTLGRAGVLAG